MDITIRKTWKVEDVLTDVTSAVLADPTGTYGVKRNDTDEVVVYADTVMVKASTGTYEYTFEAVDGVAYTAYVKIVYMGATYYFEQDIPAALAETAPGYSYDAIRRAIGYLVGWKRDDSQWSAEEELLIDDAIRDGLLMAYQPPATGEGYCHQWSWLKPVYEFTTEAGEEDYALPATFEEWEGDLFYAASESSRYPPIKRTSPGRLLELMQADETQTYPQWFALFPVDADGSAAQTWKLRLYPTPDAEYDLTGRYVAAQAMLSSSNPYPLGPRSFSYTVYLACMAAAESKIPDKAGPGQWTAKFMERIMADISADLSRYGTHLGMMNDGGGMLFYPNRALSRQHLLIPGSRLTYNGVDPHA
jgi:hypothetical protein